jgi:branched-chain amino acid transport system substrate-binding protein
MRRTLVAVFAVLLLTVVSSVAAQASPPIKIGAPLLLSGTGAYVGGASKETLEMIVPAFNKAGGVNGRPVEIVYYDEEAKPDVAVSVVKRLIQKDQVQAIVGISTSWTAMPAIPVIEQAKTPAILLAAATAIADPVKPWVFKTVPDDRITVARMLADMQSKGIERIALTTSQDAFGDGGRTEVAKQAPAHNIKIVLDERYNMDDADITPLLSKIKNTDAQAVVNWSSRRALVVMTNNYRQVGLTLPLYHSNAALSPDFTEATGKNAEGVRTASAKILAGDSLSENDPQKKVINGYMKAYKEKYGKEGTQFGAIAFDAFNILTAALKKAPEDKAKLRDAIEQTKGYVGVMGVFTYGPKDHAGLARDSLVMYEVQGGSWKLSK